MTCFQCNITIVDILVYHMLNINDVTCKKPVECLYSRRSECS